MVQRRVITSYTRITALVLSAALFVFGWVLYPRFASAAITISNVQVANITQNSATVSWDTDILGDSWVGFMIEGATEQRYAQNGQFTQSHVIQLTDLTPGSKYIYEVNSQSPVNDTAYISDLTFTTLGSGGGGGGGGSTDYPCGQLAKEGQGIFILTGKDKVKIPFTSMAAFNGLGYNLQNVKTANLSAYRLPTGYFLSSATQEHPWCSWLKWRDGTVYYHHPSGMIPVPSWSVFLSNGGAESLILPMNKADDAIWEKAPNLQPLQANDSRIL
ncbi:MAG: fibronectin type III domain-containing protein [Candidatus Doudnabacteria bacterium]|nr:fibronectin type III domain-containing protein [Candidatus Doudnabacteria bacterium]